MIKKNIVIIFILFLLISCGNFSKSSDLLKENEASSDKLQVYASIYPIYDFVKKIGADKIDAYNITSAGTEPHDFEITSKDMADLTKADLFIYNGGGMEQYIDNVKKAVKEIKYIEASSNMSIEGLDPHFWISPLKAKKQMENIKNALSEIDSDNADYYNSNYNFYADKLDRLDNSIKDSLSKIKNTNLVVTHPAFGHFCRAYSLNQVAIARDEADPKTMSGIIDFIKNNNVKAVFCEDFSSSNLADSIAKETGVKILTLNPIESLSAEHINSGEDYFSVMEKNIISLTNGLN